MFFLTKLLSDNIRSFSAISGYRSAISAVHRSFSVGSGFFVLFLFSPFLPGVSIVCLKQPADP